MKRAVMVGGVAGAVAGGVGLMVSGAVALETSAALPHTVTPPPRLVAPSKTPAPTIPIMPGQDPSVVWHEGAFYLVQSENGPGITGLYIYRSDTLEGLGHGEKRCIWRAPARGPLSRNVWAPELVWIDDPSGTQGTGGGSAGHWYIYFAADDGRNENHRMYALQSAGTDPLGAYMLKGKVADPTADRWAIDGTVLDLGNKTGAGERRLFFIWSGWQGYRNGIQNLYIAPMANPWTISGPRVRISSPDRPWERRSGPSPCYVNEGPAVLLHQGRIFLAYSANGFWSDDYALGFLSCASADPLNAAAWKKLPGPAFSKSGGLYATGHNCFVHVPTGPSAGWWNVFHAIPAPGQNGEGREIYAQRFEFDPQGIPMLRRAGLGEIAAALHLVGS